MWTQNVVDIILLLRPLIASCMSLRYSYGTCENVLDRELV